MASPRYRAPRSAARNEVDWSKLEVELRYKNARRLGRTLTLASIGPLAIALSVWGLTPEGRRLESALFETLSVGCVIGIRIASDVVRTRRLARLAEPTEFFAAHRAELAREIRHARMLRWVALAVITAFLGLAACMPDPTGHGRLVYGLLAAIVAAVWGQRLLVELPRKRRELASLDEQMTTPLGESPPG